MFFERKWIGQNVYDYIAIFRNTVTFQETVTFQKSIAQTSGDFTLYDATDDGNPTISLGSSATNRLKIEADYNSGAQTLNQIRFYTDTTSATANDGQYVFYVDDDATAIFAINDGGVNLTASRKLTIGGNDILSDSSGTTTLSNIDDLDATTIATFNSHLTAGDITGVTAGTNLSGGGSSGDVTVNLADASTSAKGAASFSSDDFDVSSGAVTIKEEGIDLTSQVSGVLPSANLDSDTAHLSGSQTFTGEKTFPNIIVDGDRSVTPGDGSMIHVDTSDITDGNTSASGTATKYTHVNIENPRLLATNASITTTDAATLYIKGAPVASTNQTITNAHAIWVDAGNVRLDGNLTLDSVALSAVQTSGESFADNDTSLMTSAAIDDAILKGGSTTTIKILPHQFMSNEDGGVNKSEQYDDTGTIGVRASSADAELYAFVEIPIGKTATSVTIYGSDTNNVVEVFEADINASGLTDKTPGGGCVVGSACDMTDVAADATNYLAIRVTVTATSDIIYGGAVTISG